MFDEIAEATVTVRVAVNPDLDQEIPARSLGPDEYGVERDLYHEEAGIRVGGRSHVLHLELLALVDQDRRAAIEVVGIVVGDRGVIEGRVTHEDFHVDRCARVHARTPIGEAFDHQRGWQLGGQVGGLEAGRRPGERDRVGPPAHDIRKRLG